MAIVEKIDISNVVSLAELLWNQRSPDPEPVYVAGLELDVQGITAKLTQRMGNGDPEKFRSGTWPREDQALGTVSIVRATEDTIQPATSTITVNWTKGGNRWSLGAVREIPTSTLRQVNITNQDQRASFAPQKVDQA